MKMIQLISLLVLSVIINGCEPIDNKLLIANETDRLLLYIPSKTDSIVGSAPVDGNHSIPRHGEKHITVMGSWENKVQYNFNGKLWVITFDSDTLEKYGWEDVKCNNRYYSKQSFTLSDLKKANWEVRVK